MLRKIAGGIGLVISEYPLDAPPLAYHFPHRNRIIAGLCMGVVLVEGKVRSGGMHTISAALAQGREVFAVPGRVGSEGAEGPHTLLREGARIVTSAQELLEDLRLTPVQVPKKTKRTVPSAANDLQRRILSLLRIEPMRQDELAERLAIDDVSLMVELGTMEIMGTIRREAGNLFSLPVSSSR